MSLGPVYDRKAPTPLPRVRSLKADRDATLLDSSFENSVQFCSLQGMIPPFLHFVKGRGARPLVASSSGRLAVFN